MKKLCVNSDMCIRCGACAAVDEMHFSLDDEGVSEVISNDNLDTFELQNAMDYCPVNAISIIDIEDSNIPEREIKNIDNSNE